MSVGRISCLSSILCFRFDRIFGCHFISRACVCSGVYLIGKKREY